MKRFDISEEEEVYFTLTKIHWILETCFHSNPTVINANHNAHRIIAMGEKALFLIFEDMKKEPCFEKYENFCHWYQILRDIVKPLNLEFPKISYDMRGKIYEMNDVWIDWVKEHNYAS
jgi:hypothetical protein